MPFKNPFAGMSVIMASISTLIIEILFALAEQGLGSCQKLMLDKGLLV